MPNQLDSIPTLFMFVGEDRTYEFDYSLMPEIKDNGETITGAGSVAITPSGPTLGTPAISADTKKVLVRISGATNGVNYLVTNTNAS
jgi:hypothetical protein